MAQSQWLLFEGKLFTNTNYSILTQNRDLLGMVKWGIIARRKNGDSEGE